MKKLKKAQAQAEGLRLMQTVKLSSDHPFYNGEGKDQNSDVGDQDNGVEAGKTSPYEYVCIALFQSSALNACVPDTPMISSVVLAQWMAVARASECACDAGNAPRR